MPIHLPAALILMLFGLQDRDARPPDFSIRLSFSTCVAESMDPATGVYERSLGTGEVAKAKIKLAPADLQDLFDAVVVARFSELPAKLRAENADGTINISSPSTLFQVEVRRGGASQTVAYSTGVTGDLKDVRIERFNQLISRVLAVFRAKTEVKALPSFKVACL
jgi:hypothetical protein